MSPTIPTTPKHATRTHAAADSNDACGLRTQERIEENATTLEPGSRVAADTERLRNLKARQQRVWASGDFGVIATLIHGAAEGLVERADLDAGSRVLDVATGSGNAAIAAARGGAEVTGIDYVPALLARARVRAEVEGLAIDFREGDAEALPFADASFDAALSIYGVMFAPDQERAARELVRVTRPGGKIALANWTPEGFIGAMFRCVAEFVPPPAGAPSPLRWGTPAGLRDLFDGAFAHLSIERRRFVFRFRSPSEFVDVFRRFYGPTHAAFAAVGEARAPALSAALEFLATTWSRSGSAPIAIPAEYLEVVGVRR